MKVKKIILAFLLFSISLSSLKGQVLVVNNNIADAYYGYGIITKAAITAITNNSSVEVKSNGLFGVRYEYLIHKNIGIGIDGNFSQSQISWTDTDSVILSTSNTYKVTRTIVRFMPRANVHLYPADNLDLFFGISGGYRHVKYKIKTTDPLFTEASLPGTNPIAFRLSVGSRYFISENIGLNAELGIGGGALIQVGISVKI